jgi:hypothetical protein
MHPAARIGLGLPAIALVGAAIFQVSLTIVAERALAADTITALEQATHLTPGDASLFARLAQLDPTRKDALDTALRLNGRESSWWIMRAVDEEQSGNLTAAESSLKRSVAMARYFVPNWNLAAFYYRYQNVPAFLTSAHATLASGAGDPESIFRMAANLKIAPDAIGAQVPDNPEIIASWLQFALENRDWAGAQLAAGRLLALGSKSKNLRDYLLRLCDGLLSSGQVDEAMALWNRLSQAGWIAMPRLDRPGVDLLTDGTFSLPRLQAGFDWRLIAPTNVAIIPSDSRGIRLEFDGYEPENCELISQYVPIASNQRYRLTTRYHTNGIPPPSGVRWIVVQGSNIIGTSTDLTSEDSTTQTLEFRTPPEVKSTRVVLKYERESGTVRIAGRLWIDSVRLEPIREAVRP